jgi:hypothetical protein
MKDIILTVLVFIVLLMLFVRLKPCYSGYGECAKTPSGTPYLVNKNVKCDALFPGMGYVDGPTSGNQKQCCKP